MAVSVSRYDVGMPTQPKSRSKSLSPRPAVGVASRPGIGETVTLAKAAQLLGCNRPHVAMLLDAGRLKGATTSTRGHVRILVSSVIRYLEAQDKGSAADYKQAARDAGMYAVPDEVFVNALAGKPSKKAGRST